MASVTFHRFCNNQNLDNLKKKMRGFIFYILDACDFKLAIKVTL